MLVNVVGVAVTNFESTLSKKETRLPNSEVLMSTIYHPRKDVSHKQNVQEVHIYQELIVILRWAVKIGRVDILLEMALFSSHLVSI